VPGVLSFFDPEPPNPVCTRNVPFDVVVQADGGPEGARVIVTLSIDGVALPTQIAIILNGIGHAFFEDVTLTRTPSSTLTATAPGFTQASMGCVVNP